MYEKMQDAFKTGLFTEGLCEVVAPPTISQIDDFCQIEGIYLSPEHRALLLEWGGSNLDEIRIHGIDQVSSDGGFVEFANDYNGSVFKYTASGAVFVESTDGGETRQLAGSVEEFINDVLLGEKGSDFYGQDWVKELRIHGLV